MNLSRVAVVLGLSFNVTLSHGAPNFGARTDCSPKKACDEIASVTHAAISTKNPKLCETLNQSVSRGRAILLPSESQHECKLNCAIELKDPDFCRTLDTEAKIPGQVSQRDKCTVLMARKLNRPEMCDSISGEAKHVRQEEYKKLCRIKTMTSVDQCKVYSDADQRECTRAVAENTDSLVLCKKMPPSKERYDCLRTFMSSKNKASASLKRK